MKRLNAGYCMVHNPYNHQVYRVSLLREQVDGFVFWTKNVAPMLDKLPELKQRGYPFIVQYTINNYPRALEVSVVDATRSVEHLRQIARDYGSRVAVWRYDTIIFSSVFGEANPADFHRRNFAELAHALDGATDEVVISFAQIYKKTLRNMQAAARAHHFTWDDPDDATKKNLVADLTAIARSHRMQLTVCAQVTYTVSGAQPAHCIDARRLADVAGKSFRIPVKGNRPECMCYLSRDIGAYDTCPHGCVYCYAVQHRRLARQRYRLHHPDSEFLFSAGTPPPVTQHEKFFLNR